ncbi:hypothetical protein [Meridianimarinicoccus aquatilis]|uniref:Colicin transporter n=1 Tax=Meridianimarinicoccus aquatilis TaxID=2552766 RepID=A0A4R6B2H9_9RHOB|nr:hypothetical protein [Fluviibacterium aquatile]TDL90947.1 hypothetical protein E2L05_02790 [Fluviibacterium aquatile]
MPDISELEQRLIGALARMRTAHLRSRQTLAAALGRIAELESTPAPAMAVDPDAIAQANAEIARLTAALDAEREQSAAIARQAEADRSALAEAQAVREAQRATGRLEKLQHTDTTGAVQARLTELEQGLEQLRAVNTQLRQNNAALRKAHEAGISDPELINGALQTEIDALQAARNADRAEIDSILAALKPLVEETEDA